ncbi:hypothetical protein HDU98_002759 [Podochytrium sp. JEL0797]|nr:hypothetical protein HDU98_002759 [Podochytrium sp. JEL0797]
MKTAVLLSASFLAFSTFAHNAPAANLFAQDTELDLDFATSQKLLTRSVAIIGAGSAGASAAMFTSKWAPEDVAISVFEASDRVGGRASTFKIPAPSSSLSNDPVTVEIGASIFVASNKHLMDAVKEFNLTFSSDVASDSEPFDGPDLGIFDGSQFVFTADAESSWKTVWDAVWRWGFISPYRARSLALAAASQFANAYKLEDSHELGYSSIFKLLTAALGMDPDVLKLSAQEYLRGHGVSDAFLSEFVEPAIRVNYGQNLSLNALSALICLTAAFTPADSVFGGNHLLFEKMIKHSQAKLHLNQQVSSILKSSGGGYTLLDSTGSFLGTFSDVIIATPNPSNTIDLSALERQPRKMEYVHLHVTLVTGTLDPKFFNLANAQDVPDAILTTALAGPLFNSIGTRHRFKNDAWNTTVTKLFSSSRLEDAHLEKMYGRVERVDRFEWDAYPVLKTWGGEEVPVVLDEGDEGGVYFVNAFEAAFSAMEGETVASANVVQLMLAKWKEGLKE